MKQASRFDGLSFDPFSLFQNGLAASEVNISRGEVLQALVIAPVVVVVDKRLPNASERDQNDLHIKSDAPLPII